MLNKTHEMDMARRYLSTGPKTDACIARQGEAVGVALLLESGEAVRRPVYGGEVVELARVRVLAPQRRR